MGVLSKAFGDEYDHQGISSQAAEAMQALQAQYPDLINLINSGKTTTAQGDLAAAKAVTPGYNDLALAELQRIAPGMLGVQTNLDAQQTRADTANLTANGSQLAAAMRSTDAAANPEFYKTLGDLSGKYGELLNSTQQGLSPGQRAEVERGLNRVGGQADNSAVDTLENAMAFGQAGQAQQGRFADIINSVAGNLGALKSGLAPVNIALGRDGRSATGGVQTTTAPTGEATKLGAGLYDNFLGTVSGINKQKAGAFKTWGDAVLQDTESISNLGSTFGFGG